MTKKKFYGVSSSVSKGIRDTLSAVENNLHNFRFSIVTLSQIELDPDNPRDLLLSIDDVKNGLAPDDPDLNRKQREVEALTTLADTINRKGLINPVVVYKYRDKYRLVAGERRCLAHHLAKKEDIQARVLAEKPSLFDIKLLQWIENNERKDLSLKERLVNIRAILEAYKEQSSASTVSATTIKDVVGLSKSQAHYYHQVLEGPQDLIEAIENDQIKNLDKAAIIASIESETIRNKAINACINGATLSQLKQLAQTVKNDSTEQDRRPGRLQRKINLGTTENSLAIRNLVMTVVDLPAYKEHADRFKKIQWAAPAQVSKAFRDFLQIFEESTKQ